MAVISRSAKAFLERAGVRTTDRRPLPACVPGINLVHSTPLAPPLPLVEVAAAVINGVPPPDRGRSVVWPHGRASTMPA